MQAIELVVSLFCIQFTQLRTPCLHWAHCSCTLYLSHAWSLQLLVNHGSDVFDLNADGETACDLAVKTSHFDVADFLELKMVFAVSGTIDGSLQVVVHSLSC